MHFQGPSRRTLFKTSVIMSRWFSFIDRNHRFITPALVVLMAKMIGASLLYQRIVPIGFTYVTSPGAEVLLDGGASSWVHIFHGWDSYHYLQIAKNWYVNLPLYEFFPLYPISIRLFSFGVFELKFSAFLVSLLFGIASMPLFQRIAENYMDEKAALGCTLLMFFFPYVFFFTTIAYSESLFLFTTLASWYFHLKTRNLIANIFASMATLTRPYGIFIVIPIFLDLIHRRKRKQISYILIPIVSLASWMYYCSLATDYWLGFARLEARQIGSEKLFPDFVTSLLNFPYVFKVFTFTHEFTLFIAYLAITTCLVHFTLQLDWRLGSYTYTLFFALVLEAAVISYVRFFAFIFPIWLILRVKNQSIVISACAFSFIYSLMIWSQFLLGAWIA